jgi:hypothetical protein
MDVQLKSLHRNTGISKDCDSDTSSLQTLEFGGNCWIFYGLGPFIEETLRCVMVENTNSTILEVQGSFGLTYMVGIIPLNLRSQEMDKGVPRARRRHRRRGVAWQARGEQAWCGCVNF